MSIVDKPAEASPVAGVAERVTSAAVLLMGRRALVTAMSVTSTSLTARALGTDDFGQLSSALATYYLLLALSDFGFSLVLARRLSVPGYDTGASSRAGAQLQTIWASVLGLVAVGIGLAGGLHTVRGQAILILAPAVVSSGLVGLRQVFLTTHRLRSMTAIDIITSVAQFGAMITFATTGLGATWIAGAVAAGTIANSIACAVVALRMVGDGRPAAIDRRSVLAEAVPLGFASVIASAYFTVDMVILPYLTDGAEVGRYGAAVKVLSIIVIIPGVVMNAALPGFSAEVADEQRLSELVSRVWHLMAATALPVCAAVGVFAPGVITLLFGSEYVRAVPLLRVLAAAGAVAVVSNILGTILVARGAGRRMVVQNLCGLAFSLGATVVFVPLWGGAAAAWITLATEVGVCLASLRALTGRVRLRPALVASLRTLAAIGAAMAAALATYPWPVLGAILAAGVFALAIWTLGGWPSELRLLVLRRRG